MSFYWKRNDDRKRTKNNKLYQVPWDNWKSSRWELRLCRISKFFFSWPRDFLFSYFPSSLFSVMLLSRIMLGEFTIYSCRSAFFKLDNVCNILFSCWCAFPFFVGRVIFQIVYSHQHSKWRCWCCLYVGCCIFSALSLTSRWFNDELCRLSSVG